MPAQRRARPTPETTPLPHPEYYQYDLNLADIAETWRHGRRDQLVAASIYRRTRCRPVLILDKFAGRVSDSGEGRLDHESSDRHRLYPRRS